MEHGAADLRINTTNHGVPLRRGRGFVLALSVVTAFLGVGCDETKHRQVITDAGHDGGLVDADTDDGGDASVDADVGDAGGDGGPVDAGADDAVTMRVIHVSPAALLRDPANGGTDGDLDLYANGDYATPLLTSVSYANVSANVYRPTGTYDFAAMLHSEAVPGMASAIATAEATLADRGEVTLVAWNDETLADTPTPAVHLAALSPLIGAPALKVRMRFFQASTRAGTVDLWLDAATNEPMAQDMAPGSSGELLHVLGPGIIHFGLDLDGDASPSADNYEAEFEVDLRGRSGQVMDAFLVQDGGHYKLLLFRTGSGGEAPLIIVSEL